MGVVSLTGELIAGEGYILCSHVLLHTHRHSSKCGLER